MKRPSDLSAFRREKPADWSMEHVLKDRDFFERYEPGDIAMELTPWGKSVSGFMRYIPKEERYRDTKAQGEAGGADRRADDQGGDLLCIAGGGKSLLTENLTPMNGNLNQGEYKALELDLLSRCKEGDDVYVEIDSFGIPGSQRPDGFFYHWASRNKDTGQVEYGFEHFANERSDFLDRTEDGFDAEEESLKAAIDDLSFLRSEGLDIPPELLDAEDDFDLDALDALADEFDGME